MNASFCYRELHSKNNPGVLRNVTNKPKGVKVFCSINEGRCLVRLLKTYLSMTEHVKREDAFYMRATKSGFTCQPVAHEVLDRLIPEMRSEESVQCLTL